MRFPAGYQKTFPRVRRLRVVGAVSVVAASVWLTGCGADNSKTTATASVEPAKGVAQMASPSATAQPARMRTARKALLAATKVTFDKAAATAVGEVPGGKVTDLDLEGLGTNGRVSPVGPAWDAEVVQVDGSAHDIRIDAVSGAVIRSSADRDQDADDKREKAQLITKAKLTANQAAEAASKKKSGTVTAADLDDNDGNGALWSVDIVAKDGTATNFYVDANGTVVREEIYHD